MSAITRTPAFHFPMTMALFSFVAACLLLTGCVTDERPLDHVKTAHQAWGFESVALANGKVGLRWQFGVDYTHGGSDNYGNEGYRVQWEPADGVVASPNDTGTSYFKPDVYDEEFDMVVSGLGEKLYRFTLHTVYGPAIVSGKSSECLGAPSDYHITDLSRPDEEIRLYERSSGLGSGVVLSPTLGGPRRVTVATSPPQSAELELLVDGEGVVDGTCRIVSLARHGLPNSTEPIELSNTTVLIANDLSGLTKPPLDQWYQPSSLTSFIYTTILLDDENGFTYDAANSFNLPVRMYEHSMDGYGFIVRIEEGSGFRYARVHVMHENGAILRGEAPHRYVVLTVSMGHPGVPYA